MQACRQFAQLPLLLALALLLLARLHQPVAAQAGSQSAEAAAQDEDFIGWRGETCAAGQAAAANRCNRSAAADLSGTPPTPRASAGLSGAPPPHPRRFDAAETFGDAVQAEEAQPWIETLSWQPRAYLCVCLCGVLCCWEPATPACCAADALGACPAGITIS